MLHQFLSTVSTANVHQVASVVIGVVWVLLIPLGIVSVWWYRHRRRRNTTVSTDNSMHHNVVFVVVRRDGSHEERVYDPASTELVGRGNEGIIAAKN